MKPSLSVVVPWRDRPEFADTLAANRQVLPADTQWIVANGGGDKAAVEAMVAGVGATVVHLPLRRWTKGPVQNVGASFAESDRLLLLDCDIEFDRDGWSVMANALEVDTVVTLAKVFDESERSGAMLLFDEADALVSVPGVQGSPEGKAVLDQKECEFRPAVVVMAPGELEILNSLTCDRSATWSSFRTKSPSIASPIRLSFGPNRCSPRRS